MEVIRDHSDQNTSKEPMKLLNTRVGLSVPLMWYHPSDFRSLFLIYTIPMQHTNRYVPAKRSLKNNKKKNNKTSHPSISHAVSSWVSCYNLRLVLRSVSQETIKTIIPGKMALTSLENSRHFATPLLFSSPNDVHRNAEIPYIQLPTISV